MPRARKPKPDDIRLTLHVERRFPRKKIEDCFNSEMKHSLAELKGMTEDESQTKRERNRAARQHTIMEQVTFPAFATSYLTDDNYTMHVEEGMDGDTIEEFVDLMVTELWDDCERESRKRKRKVTT